MLYFCGAVKKPFTSDVRCKQQCRHGEVTCYNERINIGVLFLSAEGSKLDVDRNDEKRPHCPRGRGAAGKIIVNNTQNLLGTYLAMKFSRHCTINYSDQQNKTKKEKEKKGVTPTLTFNFIKLSSNISTGPTHHTTSPSL